MEPSAADRPLARYSKIDTSPTCYLSFCQHYNRIISVFIVEQVKWQTS